MKHLHYRAWHRGTKELDLILGRFYDTHFNALPLELKKDFEALLELEDPLLYDWLILGVSDVRQNLKDIVNRILYIV